MHVSSHAPTYSGRARIHAGLSEMDRSYRFLRGVPAGSVASENRDLRVVGFGVCFGVVCVWGGGARAQG